MWIDMKRTLIFFVAGISLLSACRKEGPAEPSVPISVTFHVSAEQKADASKVHLTDVPEMLWDDDDSLAVFDGSGKNLFRLSARQGAEASFVGQVSGSAVSFAAVCPWSAAGNWSDGFVTVTIPSEQCVPDGMNADPAALLCVASATSENRQLSFRNLFSLIKVSIPSSAAGKVSSLVLRGKSGEKLAGTLSVKPGAVPVITPVSAVSSVTLRPASGGTFAAGDYFFAVIPVQFTAGFVIDMTRKDGCSASKETDKPLSLARNEGSNLADVVTGLNWTTTLSTREQLFAWNANYSSWTADDVVTLGADIDMGMQEWTPHTFRGTFDGRGHKLYHINVANVQYAGFFSDLYGTVSNLTLGTADGEVYDGSSLVRHETTTITGWSYVGSVAGRLLNPGSVSGVTNFVPIELGAGDTQKCCMGGIVGYSSSKAEWTFDACVNHGDISNLADASSVNTNVVGGIVSKCDAATGIRQCISDGRIIIDNPKVQWIGGIIGATNGFAAIDNSASGTFVIRLEDCTHSGSIELRRAYSPCVGGVTGLLCGADLLRCANTGSVTSSMASELKIGGIAGKFDKFNACTLTDCTNGSADDWQKGRLTYAAATGTAYAYMGGILGNAPSAATGALTLTRCNNYAELVTEHGYVRELGGISGRLNLSGCDFLMEDCHNYGTIRNNSAVEAGENTVAGLVANLTCKNAAAVSILNCSNEAPVRSDKPCSANGYLGGLVGTGNRVYLKNCVNKGAVTANAVRSSYMVGGIAAFLSAGTVEGCANSGDVYDKMTSYCSGKYRTVGGVLGRADKSSVVSGCTNTGAVSADFNTNNQLAAVGGIWADPRGGAVCRDNVNRGAVRATNVSSTSPHAFAGGIIGSDNETSGGAVVISGNVNEADIKAVTNSAAAKIGAGGLSGRLVMSDPAGIADNSVLSGSITCLSAGAAVSAADTGGPGAACGICELDGTWPITVGSSLTVEGKRYADVQSSVMSLSLWACPLNRGSITVTLQ